MLLQSNQSQNISAAHNVLGYSANAQKVPYVFSAVEGDHLVVETHTPNDGLGQVYNALSLKLTLYAPNGAVVPAADYTYATMDGRNVRIVYTVPVGASGVYRVDVEGLNNTEGNYVLSVTGATANAAQTLQVTNTSVQNGASFRLGFFPSSLQFTFSDSVLLSSVSTAALSVNGQIPPAFTIIDGKTIAFDLTGLNQGEGSYHVQLSGLYDIHGNALAPYNLSFNYDLQPPVVSAISIAPDAVLPEQPLDLLVTFSEALDPSFLNSANVVLVNTQTGVQVAVSSFTYDAVTRQLRVLFPVLSEAPYRLSLLNGGFRDLAGNRLNGGSDFAVNFQTDTALKAYPTPLIDKLPAGSLIFENMTTGIFHAAGDIDSFTLAFDAGQVLTLELTPLDGAVQGRIAVVGPDGTTVLGTADAQAAGQTVLLQTIPVSQAGTYRINASSIAGIGRYRVRAVLNAVIAVDANSTQQTAQSLTGSFISLGGTATRGAVRGNLDGGNSDWYSFTLNAGQIASVALSGDTDSVGAGIKFELYTNAGVLIAAGVSGATNIHQYLQDFLASETGEYCLKVFGSVGAYGLVVTRNASINIELGSADQALQNLTPGFLNDISQTGLVMGSLGGRSGSGGGGKVAVVVSGNTSNDGGYAAIASQLNDDTFFDFTATTVRPDQIDTLAELSAYDVLVIGNTGYGNGDGFAQFASALSTWVQNGGGLVATGWTVYGAGGIRSNATSSFGCVAH
ncbi:Ig-like domain-containing protein [Polaromonas sp. P2-4]|nr:Ig-like domain-containing protein [Polaromonas sp. P2-4]